MPHRPRTRLAAALCAALLPLLAGCGTAHGKGEGVLGSIQVTPGTGGTAPVGLPGGGSPTPGASGAGGGGQGGGGQSGAPGTGGGTGTSTPTAAPPPGDPTPSPSAATPYPPDYALAILNAWAAHDLVLLTLLTDPLDATQLLSLGDPDRHWTQVTGDGGAAGSSYAAFYNASGDWLVLKLNDSSLAAHLFHAGKLNTWDPISYPRAATAYAKEFVDGWVNGNTARMTKLSSTAVTSYFLTLTAPDPGYTLGTPDSGAGHTHVPVTEASVSLDTALSMVISTLGAAHAIDGCTPGCS